jgi:hypothetical protein
MKSTIIIFITALALHSCTVKDVASTSEAEKMAERFFLNYEKQGPKASLKAIINKEIILIAGGMQTDPDANDRRTGIKLNPLERMPVITSR